MHQLATLTVRYAVPAIYQFREFAAAGGLMSYGPDIKESYRSDSQGRKARRPPGPAGDQGRDVHQPEDRQGARHHRATPPVRPRRRVDRVGPAFAHVVLLHLLTAAIGTSRTSGDVRLESAKWAKADID